MNEIDDPQPEEPTLLDFRVFWIREGIASTYYPKVSGSNMQDRMLTLFMEDGFVVTVNVDATTAIEFWPSE